MGKIRIPRCKCGQRMILDDKDYDENGYSYWFICPNYKDKTKEHLSCYIECSRKPYMETMRKYSRI
jgi:hypothetical protein